MQTKRIKVFFFIDRFRIGGMHRQVLYLVRHLNKDVFEPIVCAQSHLGGLGEEFKDTGCKLIDLKWNGRGSLAILYRLIESLYSESPDIIFITQAPNFIYYQLARIFWHKTVILIGSFRALTFWLGHKNKLYELLDIQLSKLLYIRSDHVVVNSIAMKDHYSQVLKLNSHKGLDIILNGSDFNFPISRKAFDIRGEYNITLNEIIIVMIARLDPWKDFTTLLETAKIVIEKDKRAKFLIVGDGELRKSIEQLIIQMDLKEHVLLIGEKKDVFNFINLSDISVLSTNGEGFSNSILESMAFSKPIVATAVGGNVELIGETKKYGLLIPQKSPQMFAEAILYLMQNEIARKEIGSAANKRIQQLCSIKTYVSSYEELFSNSLIMKS